MPSPDTGVATRLRWLAAKEWRELIASRATLVFALCVGPLVGHAFATAVSLYAEASGAGGGPAALSQGLSPLDGIVVPTFGAYAIAAMLLFPFVGIRAVASEKESGALSLLVQSRATLGTMVAVKFIILLATWVLAWIPGAVALVMWRASGGHLYAPEVAGALLGYEIVGTTPDAPQGDAALAIASLRTLAQNRGSTWPTKSLVGAQGVRAVWLLASRDSALARVALHRMMEAGPEESPPAAVAILEDRLRIANGRKQLYATQLVKSADGKLEPAAAEDPKHVDLRRDAAGLPPLAQAICAASKP